MRVYLDNSALQRPLDTKNQARIILEAEAVLVLIAAVEEGRIELVDSEVLQFEVRNTPAAQRRTSALEVLRKANVSVQITDNTEVRSNVFAQSGLKPIDALHLASAEEIEAQYFCTCDDGILKKREKLTDCKTKIVTPVELVEELGL